MVCSLMRILYNFRSYIDREQIQYVVHCRPYFVQSMPRQFPLNAKKVMQYENGYFLERKLRQKHG